MEKVYRLTGEGKIIRGVGLPAFIHNITYHYALIKIYEDGLIDCWPPLVNLEEFKQKVQEGWVVTQVPEGAPISCHHLYHGESNLTYLVQIDEFVKEVEDILRQFQDKPTSTMKCQSAFNAYLQKPSSVNKLVLDEAYHAVPAHLRQYILGDMDAKDAPIRAIIQGNRIDPDELEYWQRCYGVTPSRSPETASPYHSEEEEIVERFGLSHLATSPFLKYQRRQPSGESTHEVPRDRAVQVTVEMILQDYHTRITAWLTTHSLTETAILRYMLVGFSLQFADLRKNRHHPFKELIATFSSRIPAFKRKLELFERIYGKSLDSFEEYEALFPLQHLHNFTGEDVFRFVVDGMPLQHN